MGLFTRGKNREELARENAANLNSLVSSLDVLIEMAQAESVKKDLDSIREELKYSSPTRNSDALRVENKIGNHLGDLKILLTAKPDSPKIAQLVQDIRLLIVERNSKR